MLIWGGGMLVLYTFRFRAKRNAYFRRFEHEIDFFAGDPIFYLGSRRAYREVVRKMREPQPDAEMERLRRDMMRSFRDYLIWVFGFPVAAVTVMVFLIAIGIARFV
jgi:hypothetical protein